MLRAILSNRLSSNNEAKENRTIHKTPSKKALNKTIGNNKLLKNGSSTKKLNKLQAHGNDLNALNIISDDKELLKQNSLKTPLKISQQRAPLSNIKKANVKEKSLKNLNNQYIKKTPHSSMKKKSSASLSHTPTSSSLKINQNNHKFHNENENIPLRNKSLKRHNSLSSIVSNTTTTTSFSANSKKINNNNNNNNNNNFENTNNNSHHTSSQEAHTKENIFITHMKNNTILNDIDDIEYMPPSLSHLKEEIEPKYKIDYEKLINYKPVTVVDSDLFKRVNEEIDIELDPEANALKTKNFEFVNDFILDLDSDKSKKNKEKETKNNIVNENENENKENIDDDEDKNKDDIIKKQKEKALQEKLSQDFNISFEEASEDEEIKLPDFLTTEDHDSLYFDEIQL